jgi:hypothetical protein
MNPNTKIIGPDRPDTCTPTRTGDIIEGGAWDGFEVISTYSRAQAIADGVLVDLTNATDRDGRKIRPFKYPVAMTEGAYNATIAAGGRWVTDPNNPDGETLQLPPSQNLTGRLWDVFSMMLHAIRASGPTDRVTFSVLVDRDGNGKHKRVDLWSSCGPGDNAEPVLTIMLEGED